MKHFNIQIATFLSNKGHCSFAAQSKGTLNPRPIVSDVCPNAGHAEAAFTGSTQALEDLSSFLSEGDAVDILVSFPDASASLAKGSSNPSINQKLRNLVLRLNAKGISVALQESEQPPRDLRMKAEMALAMRA